MQTKRKERGGLAPLGRMLRLGCREAADLLVRQLLRAAADVHRR